MRRMLLALALLCSWTRVGADSAPPEPVVLTCPQACQLALVKSPRAGAALARVRQAQADLEVTKVPERTTGSVTLLGPPVPASLANIRSEYVLSPIRLEIRQMLFDGGKVRARIDQARASAQGQAQQARADWHQLCLEVRLSYLDALRNRSLEQVSQEALALAANEVEVAEARLRVGQVARGDVLLAQVPLSDSESELSRARTRTRDSEDALNRVLGLPITTRLSLAEPDPPADLAQDPEGASMVEQALRQRPALLAKQLELKATGHAVEAAQRDTRPRMNVFAGMVAVSGTDQFISNLGYRAGFELTWDFWDGGLSAHLTESAQAKRELAGFALEDYRRQVEQEVRALWRATELAQKLSRTSQVQLDRARDALRIATAQYRAALAPFAQVRQAQLDLTRAHSAQVTTRYDYLAARARLEWAVGQEPETALPVPTIPSEGSDPSEPSQPSEKEAP